MKKYPNTLKGDLDAFRDTLNEADLNKEEMQIVCDYANARLGWTEQQRAISDFKEALKKTKLYAFLLWCVKGLNKLLTN